MKKTYSFMRMAMMMALTVVLSSLLFSCSSKDDEPEGGDGGGNQNSLNVYPWKDYPKSYIRLFDNRMNLQILSVVRNGPTVQVEYTLTNARFGGDVTVRFTPPVDIAHDNLGNTYKFWTYGGNVRASINGQDLSGNCRVTFKPNQPITGTFTIKNFNKNATVVSISVNVSSDITLGSDRLDFVNIPVSE